MHIAQGIVAGCAVGTTRQRAAEMTLDWLRSHQLIIISKALRSPVAASKSISMPSGMMPAALCPMPTRARNARLRVRWRWAGTFQAHGDAVGLQKLDQVAHAVVLEQGSPDQLPEQCSALPGSRILALDVGDPVAWT